MRCNNPDNSFVLRKIPLLREVTELDKTYDPKKVSIDFQKFVRDWNTKYYWDYWWRKQNKVAFGSEAHRKMSLIDMLIEYHEEKFIEMRKQKQEEEKDEADLKEIGVQKKDSGFVKMSKKQIDKEFEELDLNEFNKAEAEQINPE